MSELLRTWDTDADTRGFEFFTTRAAWQRAVVRRHPTASITRTRDGRRYVYRAYVRRIQVGAYNVLPGHGYATSAFYGQFLHGKCARAA